MPLIIGRGRNQIRLDGPLADGMEDEIREMLGPIVDEMERKANVVLQQVLAQWPVKSSKSRDAWRIELRLQPADFTVEVVLVNNSGYARYIRSTRVADGEAGEVRRRAPLVELVRKPMRAASRELADELPRLLEPLLTEALNG